jgi:hypothetical protein
MGNIDEFTVTPAVHAHAPLGGSAR